MVVYIDAGAAVREIGGALSIDTHPGTTSVAKKDATAVKNLRRYVL